MEILLNERKKIFFKEEFYYKDNKNNVIYTAKRNIFSLNNITYLFKDDELIATIYKNIFKFDFLNYTVKLKDKTKFVLQGKVDYSYKFRKINWYLTGNMKLFYNTIITLNKVLVAEIFEEEGWQPNYRINIVDEKNIDSILSTILCIYYAKTRLANKS